MSFWNGKRVLITGHTGFKGAWAGRWLAKLGAEVTGVSLAPEPGPNIFSLLGKDHFSTSHFADLRDARLIAEIVQKTQPDVVLHMAAQSLVRLSYADPLQTFGSNVLGTVHLLDALRRCAAPKAIVVITSDKVYENQNSDCARQEKDRLGGYDPYSASKAATEIVVSSYRRSYFSEMGVPIVTARAGNVIGGGDFSADRLIPDIVRALIERKEPKIRNPNAIRPWQHILDCLNGYLAYAEALVLGNTLPEALNFGPLIGSEPLTVGELAHGFMSKMGCEMATYAQGESGPYEMELLSIDPSLSMSSLQWKPKIENRAAIELTARWYEAFIAGDQMRMLTDFQIGTFQELSQ